MTSTNMSKLELGMKKEQVIDILGPAYTISSKSKMANIVFEVLSYRDFYHQDEIYLFEFQDGILNKWHREMVSQVKTNTIIQEVQK